MSGMAESTEITAVTGLPNDHSPSNSDDTDQTFWPPSYELPPALPVDSDDCVVQTFANNVVSPYVPSSLMVESNATNDLPPTHQPSPQEHVGLLNFDSSNQQSQTLPLLTSQDDMEASPKDILDEMETAIRSSNENSSGIDNAEEQGSKKTGKNNTGKNADDSTAGKRNALDPKRLRRLKNRASVERCRQKQRIRLERLTHEQSSLTEENKLLLECSEEVRRTLALILTQVASLATNPTQD